MSKRPFVVCYICGREFGSASIGIHEEQCLKKWHQQNELRPKHERLPTPIKPQLGGNGGFAVSNDEGNTKYVSTFNEAAALAACGNLVPCPTCHRTFNADRIDVHKRVCKASNMKRLHPVENNSNKSNNNTNPDSSFDEYFPDPCGELKAMGNKGHSQIRGRQSSSNQKAGSSGKSGPVFVICYICGRQFGTRSLAIHEPQCMAKWEAENKLLPKGLRRPKPVKPDTNSSNIGAFNLESWKSSQQQLLPCPNCSRRFLPDRLIVHQKTCSKNPKLNRTSKFEDQFDQTDPQSTNPQTVVCYICGRAYGTASIEIHEAKCLEKWERQNEQLPWNLQQQRPEKPSVISTERRSQKLSQYNEMAIERSHGNLVPCSKCGRTFNPDRVSIHERNCKGK